MKKATKFLMPLMAAAIMVGSVATPVLAANSATKGLLGDSDSKQDIKVEATITKSNVSEPTKVYKVDIEWTVPTLTATQGADTYVWDTTDHKYVPTSVYDISANEDGDTSIKITNHSNDAVQYYIDYANADGYIATRTSTSNFGDSESKVALAAADLKNGVLTSSARKNMLDGSMVADGLKGAETTSTAEEKIKIASMPSVSKSASANKQTVGTYTVKLNKNTPSNWSENTNN